MTIPVSTSSHELVCTMLEQHLERIVKFQEHLSFAIKLTDDEKLKAVFAHLSDEESEHAEELRAILSAWPEKTTVTAAIAAPPVSDHDTPSTTGHHQRRDQNILSVGSLFGQKQ